LSATVSKSFDTPDELRTPPLAQVAFVDLGAAKVARFSLGAGWRWSESVKPLVGTDTCQARHVGALVSGRMHVVAADGSELDITPGTAYVIAPGHDAWVVGDEPVLAFEFEAGTAATYAQPQS
jgi:hypothetical protein